MVIKEIVSDHTKHKVGEMLAGAARVARPGFPLEAGVVDFDDVSDLAHAIWYDVRSQDLDTVGLVHAISPDDRWTAHAINRAALAMRMARDLDLDQRMMELGIAALICDLGMFTIRPDVILRPGALEPHEITEVRQHVLRTLPGLTSGRSWTAFIKTAIAHHHEREDGSGYPNALSGGQIHPLGRVLGVADVFCALINDRPHRGRWVPHEALEYLVSGAGFEFNGQVVEVLYRMIPPYPVGSEVGLSTGESGVVVRVPKHLKHRPTVRVSTDSAGRPLPEPKDIDLEQREYQNCIIVTKLGQGG